MSTGRLYNHSARFAIDMCVLFLTIAETKGNAIVVFSVIALAIFFSQSFITCFSRLLFLLWLGLGGRGGGSSVEMEGCAMCCGGGGVWR